MISRVDMDSQNLEEKKELRRRARDAYYNLDPIMSDPEYDALTEAIRSIEPESPELASVGAPPPNDTPWEKVRHEISMGSLEKVNSEEEFRKWAEATGSKEFLMSEKIDGSAIELVYVNSKLVRAVTRGDGTIGEDILLNVRQIPNVKKEIARDWTDKTDRAIVRGEIVMYRDVFEKQYAEEYANPRNTANGKVRERKSGGSHCSNLVFLAFKIVTNRPDTPKSEAEQVRMLENYGFMVPMWSGGTIDQVVRDFESKRKCREIIPYEIDGMVVSVNSFQLQEELGAVNMRPRGQKAWKFDAAVGETRVEDIRWQVGPTGRVTPVAVLEPVEIGGVTITNVSLHNLSIFRDLKLFRGCRVLVSRRNDVIPYIEKNLDLEEAA